MSSALLSTIDYHQSKKHIEWNESLGFEWVLPAFACFNDQVSYLLI